MIAAVAVVHLVMVVVFAFLASKDPGAGHMRLWAISWGVGAARYGFAIGGELLGIAHHANRLAYLTLLVSGLLFMAGTYRYLQRALPRGWVVGALVAGLWIVACWILAGIGRAVPFAVETTPTFLFVGSVDVWTGAVILRSRDLGAIRNVMGWALVVWGLHRFDYPLLRPIPWTAPWGFGLAAMLGVVVAVGMLLLYFERVRREIERSEARYRSIFEHAIAGMFQASPSGRFLAANPALVRLLGHRNSQELLDRSLASVLGVEEARAPARLQELSEASRPDGVEVELCAADGSRLTAQLQLRAVDHDSHHYEGWVRDVTHAKQLQEQLLRSQKLEALGRLAGGVAHDFNNLLTAIHAGSELAEAALDDGDDPRPELEQIREASKSAADLTSQLLAFSRNQQLPPSAAQPLDVNATVQGALAILERLIGEDVRLEVELAPDAGAARADPTQLRQIVLNLAINARDAMPDGGSLRVSTRPVEREGSRFLLLEVADEGVGIDRATQERLFDPFFTTKPPGKGTGLGLATVYGIVNSLGGSIDVESAPGEGATFRVLLPSCPPAPTPAALGSARPPAGPHGSLLLVEDESIVRDVTARLLRKAGYEVLVGSDLESGLAAARDHAGRLDALVSDVVMPGGSGVELATRLLELQPELKVLFVSGYAGDELERLQALPAAHFLAKPFTAEQLQRALGELLAERT